MAIRLRLIRKGPPTHTTSFSGIIVPPRNDVEQYFLKTCFGEPGNLSVERNVLYYEFQGRREIAEAKERLRRAKVDFKIIDSGHRLKKDEDPLTDELNAQGKENAKRRVNSHRYNKQ